AGGVGRDVDDRVAINDVARAEDRTACQRTGGDRHARDGVGRRRRLRGGPFGAGGDEQHAESAELPKLNQTRRTAHAGSAAAPWAFMPLAPPVREIVTPVTSAGILIPEPTW